MPQPYNSPGVYRQETFLKAPPVLETGVPAFVGFAGPPGPVNQPAVLHRKEEFLQFFSSVDGSFLEDAVNGFFDNGGIRCYVVSADPASDPARGLCSALDALAAVDDVDLVAVPDAMTLRLYTGDPDRAAIAMVHAESLMHCARLGNRMAILDSLPSATREDVLAQRADLVTGQQEPVNGALYYPWLMTSAMGRMVPPCGHVAGIFARSDGRVGVYKAPANEEIFSVLDLAVAIDNSIQDQLNPAGINCLRAFPGRGIRVWGARTISNDPDWRYVNVRRLFLTLGRWIDLNMQWTTFEPNDQRLWVRVQRELGNYLGKLQEAGALRGASAAEAFYVKCDAENNPAEARDAGQVVIEIGLAPLAPAEFIVIRITRRAGGTPDN